MRLPAFLRAGVDPEVGGDHDPLLPSTSPHASTPRSNISQTSAFAAPEQQALGGFPDPDGLPCSQSLSASFSFGRIPDWDAQQREAQEHSTTAGAANHRSASFTYGASSAREEFGSLGSAASMQRGPLYGGGHVVPFAQVPIYPMPPPRPFHPVNAHMDVSNQWEPTSSKLIMCLNIFSFLVLFTSAPMGVLFSYYMWYAAAVLFCGPAAAGLAMIAVFFTRWGCCGSVETSVRRMKFLITAAAVIDMIGAIVTGMVQNGQKCPDTEIANCAYDIRVGRKYSVLVGIIMGIHAILCVATRFQTTRIVATNIRKSSKMGQEIREMPTGFPVVPALYRYPGFVGMPRGPCSISHPSRSFTMPVPVPDCRITPRYGPLA